METNQGFVVEQLLESGVAVYPISTTSAKPIANASAQRNKTDHVEPSALQRLAGTAPVSNQSGQIHKVYLRRHCNKVLRHAVHMWANLSRKSCPWAAVYYEQLRTRSKSHACALRCLRQGWPKILWKMWQTGTRYDAEELHARNQLKHGSWVLKIQTLREQLP